MDRAWQVAYCAGFLALDLMFILFLLNSYPKRGLIDLLFFEEAAAEAATTESQRRPKKSVLNAARKEQNRSAQRAYRQLLFWPITSYGIDRD